MKNEKPISPGPESASPLTDKKQWLFMALFVAIAAISVWAVMAQDFSPSEFADFVRGASVPWLAASLLSMLSFILFEALALLVLCRTFGHRQSLWSGYIYATSDIYFSAITPSATGGQPASAYFMVKDGMNGMMVTALLLVNLCMYTLSIIVIGVICFLFRFDLFLQYSLPAKLLIIAGFLVQIALLTFLYMLLKKEKLLQRICNAGLALLCKLRILRRKEEKQAKLDAYMERYREHSRMLMGHGKAVFTCFIFNFLQRISQLAVTLCVYIATTGQNILHAIEVFFLHGYVILGSNCIPIPGAIGISDYLMLDGFQNMMESTQATNLELLSRSFSFYSCVIICGVSTLIQYCVIKKRGRKS